MTSFSMTSLHVDLNEAAKRVDIIPFTLLASLSRLPTLVQIENGNDIWPNLRRFIVQQLVRLLFNNDFINSGLVFQRTVLCEFTNQFVLVAKQHDSQNRKNLYF